MPYAASMLNPWMNVSQVQKTRGGMSYSRTITKKRQPRRTKVKSFIRKVMDVFPAKHLSGTSAVTINNARGIQ
jgi:hypothetical protein